MMKCEICEEIFEACDWLPDYCDNTLECAMDGGESLVKIDQA